MRNLDLECVPSWRYCNVKVGEKIPYPAGWQNNPKTIKDIDSTNVGLLLGPVSGGVVALDFDGPSAWSWFSQRIGCEIPNTIMWTSGKDSRCQMAFIVPEQYWPYIKTQKIVHTKDSLIAEGEGFEFRWTGAQSVLPPSTLTDGREYTWLRPPRTSDIAEIPDAILAYWLNLGENKTVLNTNPIEDLNIDDIDVDKFTELSKLLERIKQLHPKPDYDTWMRIAFASASEVGNSVASVLLASVWPEQEAGEYARLLSSRDPSRSPTIKSLMYMIGEQSKKQHSERYLEYKKQQDEIKQLEKLIEEKRNEQSKY